jgi:spore coat protein U-like protein
MPGGRAVKRTPRRAILARMLVGVLTLALCEVAAAECSLNVVNVSFGSYDTLSPLDAEITGSIGVSCDGETTGEVSLSAGLGTFAARQMRSGPQSLVYNLYLDAAHLTIWGDGSPGTSLLSLSGTGGNYTVYGRIPARQNVPLGGYSDTITVTLTF